MQYKSLSTVGPVVLRDSLPVVHSTGVVWGSWGPCLVKSTIGFFGTAVAAVAAVAVGVDVTATVAVFLSMSVLSSFSGWMVCFGCILTLDRWWTLVTSQASWVHLYRTLIYNDLLWSIVIYCDQSPANKNKPDLTLLSPSLSSFINYMEKNTNIQRCK